MSFEPAQRPSARAASPAGIAGWMFFDWAAQPFFTVIITFIFGPYFVSQLAGDASVGQAWWGYTITAAGLVIALMSPILGAVADAAGPRKPWIAFFAVFKVAALSLLWLAAPGTPLIWPASLLVVAMIAAEFSIVFNDSMLPRLVGDRDVGRVSNIAWGMGYLGGMVFLIAVVAFLAGDAETGRTILGLDPLFGLDPVQGEGARAAGPLAALWYVVFLVPLMLFTADTARARPVGSAVRHGLKALSGTLSDVRRRAGLMRFLIARMIYQDGLNGILALGGTFAAAMFGWSTMEIGLFGIILNVVAIFGCLAASRLDLVLGSKAVVLAGLGFLLAATIGIVSTGPGFTLFGWLPLGTGDAGGVFGTAAEKAYILFGMLIGLGFGPVQASSRSYLARSVAVDEAGRFFGIYALTGRVTSFLAPFSVATITVWTGSARAGMAVLIVFLVLGLALLVATPYPAPRPAAKAR